jgi:hypothetical protein
MAVKTFTQGEVLTTADTNTYLTNGGLVYVTQSTFSAVSTASFNSCFTSSFDNYRIVGNITATASNVLYFRVRSGGTDRTNADYAWCRSYVAANATTGAAGIYGASYMIAAVANTNGRQSFSLDVFGPNLSGFTNVAGQSTEMAAAMFYLQQIGGISTATATFDGFSVLPVSGTISGEIRVYGYRQA